MPAAYTGPPPISYGGEYNNQSRINIYTKKRGVSRSDSRVGEPYAAGIGERHTKNSSLSKKRGMINKSEMWTRGVNHLEAHKVRRIAMMNGETTQIELSCTALNVFMQK
jgi:hypothetical protein